MGDLSITELKPEQAGLININKENFDITLKRDGTLIYFRNGRLFSPRCDRSDRFRHILKLLIDGNFPDCMGEMFIDKPSACVFDVSRKENWAIAKFMPFDIIDNNLNYIERQRLLAEKICSLNNGFVVPVTKFNTFKEGWDYVLANEQEGLVIRNKLNPSNWLKIKLLKEAKVEIREHEKGKDKGTFILVDGNRVSGTSLDYVEQFVEIKARGNRAIAECEFPFYTDDSKMFQPRLRQITEI